MPINKHTLTHLAILLAATSILTFFQTDYLGWHQDAQFPRWRGTVTHIEYLSSNSLCPSCGQNPEPIVTAAQNSMIISMFESINKKVMCYVYHRSTGSITKRCRPNRSKSYFLLLFRRCFSGAWSSNPGECRCHICYRTTEDSSSSLGGSSETTREKSFSSAKKSRRCEFPLGTYRYYSLWGT